MEIQEGFFQIITGAGVFFTRKLQIGEQGVTLYGPKIVNMSMVPGNKQDPRVQVMTNVDQVISRFIAWRIVNTVDALDPAALDKQTKDVYQMLSGVALT